ncbi:MAG TPA: IPT/TIG domain-containing protein [Solirubrobacteraceae bacterium]|nr:IPT/TIG domain-containing protein [Solirubrobacteraceae bacterium]
MSQAGERRTWRNAASGFVPRRRAIGLLVGVMIAAGSVVSATASAGPPTPVQVTAAAQLPRDAIAVGATPSTAPITGAVVLKPRDPGAFSRRLQAITNSGSHRYRQFLAPGQYARQFGPTPATVRRVRSALIANGLNVTGTADGGLLVEFSGSAGRVDSALGTHLENVKLPGGAVRHAATSAVHLPASIAADSTAVIGLDTTVSPQSGALHGSASAAAAHPAAKAGSFPHPAGSPNPCADATKAANTNGGLTDDQIANAYGAFGLYGQGDLGAGQHIAVYELEPFAPSDISTFDTCYFGASGAAAMAKRLHIISVDGGQPAGFGSGESLLDIEDVSAMAPGATIDVYEAPNTNLAGTDEYARIVSQDADQEITSSWGLCEQDLQSDAPGEQQAENEILQQAAAQGQTLFADSQDTGEDTCNEDRALTPPAGQNPISVEDPASQPYAVAVGGTTITDAATVPAQEQVWNDGAEWGGGGGGISQSWPMPSWQRAATVPGIDLPGSADYTQANKVEQQYGYAKNFCESTAPAGDTGEPCRLEPDVSAQADEFTGAVTVYSQEFNGWTTFGGTSSATPIWAALFADINASANCQASAPKGVGFASPLLYEVASNPAEYAASFNDITSGNNDIYGLDDGLTFPARTGYDLATGLGSPRLTDSDGTAGLAYYVCAAAAGNLPRPSVTSISPPSGSVAGGETITVTGTGFTGTGSKVAGVQIGTDALKASAFKVQSATTITATVPPAADALPPDSGNDGGGAVQVLVTLKDGASSAPNAGSTFQYVDTSGGSTVPDVTAVGPSAGSETNPAPTVIHGSGFTGATKVTFGGVPAASFTINSANQITATPAAYSSATACAPLPSTGPYAGDTATNDICQSQVRVTGPGGRSATATILPPLEGPINYGPGGVPVAPGCGCELAPAATEYDYVPTPVVSSISTSGGPADLADENGGTVITVHGAGFNEDTLEWTNFGPPSQAASQDLDVVYASGTELQVQGPAEPLTTNTLSLPFSVQSLAGLSNSVSAQFAGVPTVTSVVNTQSSTTLDGVYGGPDTGGTPLAIHGAGFAGQLVAPITFTDASGNGTSLGTQFTYSVVSNTRVNTQTLDQNPDTVDVQACTVTGCSTATSTENSTADEFILYPPGTSQVSSVTPSSGPAAGGTKVRIGGQNLGCAIAVDFGTTPAPSQSNPPTFLDCGSSTAVTSTSPAHAGGTVPVSVETAADYFTGAGFGTSTADFTYK